ncbi:protein FAM110A [Ambystoma mexicanum]|uniref:protein FAM110A n=1 Tax=Ambystoma mexicanum TaxID=8296 RepID=UPI0037E9AF56
MPVEAWQSSGDLLSKGSVGGPITSAMPFRILNKGPDYFRRQAGTSARKPSAVERLEADKAKYVKSKQVVTTRQEPIKPLLLKQPLFSPGVRRVLLTPNRKTPPGFGARRRDAFGPKNSLNLDILNSLISLCDSPLPSPRAEKSPMSLERRGWQDPHGRTPHRIAAPAEGPTDLPEAASSSNNMSESSSTSNKPLEPMPTRPSGTVSTLAKLFEPALTPSKPVSSSSKLSEPASKLSRPATMSAKPSEPTSTKTSSTVAVRRVDVIPCATQRQRVGPTLLVTPVPASPVGSLFSSTSSLTSPQDAGTDSAKRSTLLHRSKSDLSDRYSRASADLERFFNYCGLDPQEVEHMGAEHFARASSDIVSVKFHSISAASSECAPSQRSSATAGDKQDDRMPYGISVIERNARVIKWLYGLRQAREPQKVSKV